MALQLSSEGQLAAQRCFGSLRYGLSVWFEEQPARAGGLLWRSLNTDCDPLQYLIFLY